MSFYNEVREILAQLSGHDRIVTIPKLYIEMTGDLAESILLNQIVFYSDKTKRSDGFFYKSYREWTEEICLTERQVRHASNKLKDKGLIETKLLKANGSPTVHYRLDADKLVNWILTKRQNGNLQNVRMNTDKTSVSSITEITTVDNITVDNNNNYNIDERVKSVFKFYEQNGFGLLTPHVADKVGAWIEDLNYEMVLRALQIAVENGAIRWNYVDSILKDWSNKKFASLSDVEAADKQRRAQAVKPNRIAREEVVPEWLKPEQSNLREYTQEEKAEIDRQRESLLREFKNTSEGG